jgi:hypothetical protein
MKSSLAGHVAWFMLVLMLTACSSQPTPLPTAEPLTPTITRTILSLTPTAINTSTFTPRPSLTPSQVSTAVPATETKTPMPTPYFIPTANMGIAMSSAGPWMAFSSQASNYQYRVTVFNSDGTGTWQTPFNMVIQPNAGSPAIEGSPASPYLAGVSRKSPLSCCSADAALEIIRLPEKTIREIPLISNPTIPTFDYSRFVNIPSTQEYIYFINRSIGFAWSPNGRYLAFTAAIDGPTTDLYIYDTLVDQIRRLTDGLDMAIHPEWSQDSKWIIHRGDYGSAEGCTESGTWAAAVDGSEVKRLDPGKCFEITQWTGPETFEVIVPSSTGGARRSSFFYYRKRIDIATGKITALDPKIPSENPNYPIFDCVTKVKVETPNIKNENTGVDSPNGKWVAVINDHLRLYSSAGKLAAEFPDIEKFLGWRPDSGAVVFTTHKKDSDYSTLNYYQPSDQTLKTLPVNLL